MPAITAEQIAQYAATDFNDLPAEMTKRCDAALSTMTIKPEKLAGARACWLIGDRVRQATGGNTSFYVGWYHLWSAQDWAAIAADCNTRLAAQMIPLHGDTYPVKGQLKALGARWDGSKWTINALNAKAAQAIIDAQPKRERAPRVEKVLKYGELWQPCDRRGCETEPVCVNCQYCARHCTCD